MMHTNNKTVLKDAIEKIALKRAVDGVRIIGSDEMSHSNWLFDFRALLLQPRWLNVYAETFWETYADKYPFQVCGMESAAISLVSAIVMKGVERGTPVNGLYIRKSRKRQGLLKQIEGTPTDDPVILVDDLINSGGTFEKQIKILERAGKNVTDLFVLLAFRESYNLPLRLTTIFSLPDFGIPYERQFTSAAQRGFETVWHFQAPNPAYNYVVPKSAPVIDDTKVYFGTDAGTFFALDQTTGSIAWQFGVGKHPDGKGIFSSPALYSGTVYFGAYDGNVYALNTHDGSVRWKYGDADWIGSSPALAPELNLLFVGLEFGLFRKRGGIAALDMKTGAQVWRNVTPALTHSSPLYIHSLNMVVIGSNDSTVYAYNAQTGEKLWQQQVQGDVKYSFAYHVEKRSIFFGTLGGIFYALNAHDGSIAFAKELGAGVYSTPLVSGNSVYIASLDKFLYAFDTKTGKEQWSFATSGRIFSSPIIFDGSLWIGSNDGRLYELEEQTGHMKNSFQATERIVNKPAYNPTTKRIFLPTQANELYCLIRT